MNEIPLDKILPNPKQPRTVFDQAELESRAASIRIHGVIQPIAVEEAENGYYILHDGECRTRAARMAGLTMIPAYIKPPLNGSGEHDRLFLAMVANIQRSNLNPIDEGRGYAELRRQGLSVADIAHRIGVHYVRVDQCLKLLELDEPIQALIAAKKLSKDDRLTRALLDIPDRDARVQLAQALAERSATIKTSVAAAKKLAEELSAPKFVSTGAPAIDIAARRSPVNESSWDALAQLGHLPPWAMVVDATKKTCGRCSLYSVASEKICAECPVVDLLRRMLGKGSEQRD